MNEDLIKYYKERAREYEKIYFKPERQDDLQSVTAIVQKTFSGKNIIEIACGTGFWTEKIAQTTHSIFATDINETVIEVARQKHYENGNVTFGLDDIFNTSVTKKYEGLFGGFIWSHIKLEDIKKFLEIISRLVTPGGPVVFIDNNYVEGSSHPITKKDEYNNTFQERKLDNGSSHLVLKNFPSEIFLTEKLRGFSKNIKIINLRYYWIVIYTVE